MFDSIKLSHGSGTGLDELLSEIIIPILGPGKGKTLEDAAVLEPGEGRLAFTTDSFVVNPLVFKGGDIGKLAACGTINDLAMMGAVPRWISVGLILEEGLDAKLLRTVLLSLKHECDQAGAAVVCGDTKVVQRGKADGLFINTSGVGTIPEERNLSAANIRTGDAVIVSGPIGQHGVAVLAEREGLAFASDVASDCAALNGLAEALLTAVPETRALRDATRGGCAAVLNEMGKDSGVTILLNGPDIPVTRGVDGACRYLGMDPLQVANEGRFVAMVPADKAEVALAALQAHPAGAGAAVVGFAQEKGRFPLLLKTVVGGTRAVDVPHGEMLPRIC